MGKAKSVRLSLGLTTQRSLTEYVLVLLHTLVWGRHGLGTVGRDPSSLGSEGGFILPPPPSETV